MVSVDRRLRFASGERIHGRYQVESCIGGGSESQLYLCRDTNKVNYTLKVVFGKTQEVAQESATLVGLDHAGIPKLVETWADGGTAFLVREYVEGVALDRYIQTFGPLKATQVAALLLDILETVEYLHERHPALIHRDLKPHNLLLSTQRAHLIDFGLASPAGNQTGPIGSLGYSAPEQLQEGSSEKQCDIYSIGAIGLFAWTGRGPSLTTSHIALPPSKLESRGRNQPLWDLLCQCLEANPQKRPATAAEVSVAIQYWLARSGLSAHFRLDASRIEQCYSDTHSRPTSEEASSNSNFRPELIRSAQLSGRHLAWMLFWVLVFFLAIGLLRG